MGEHSIAQSLNGRRKPTVARLKYPTAIASRTPLVMVSWSRRSGVAYNSLPLIKGEEEDHDECEEEELIMSGRPRAGCTCQWIRSGIRRLNRLWDT